VVKSAGRGLLSGAALGVLIALLDGARSGFGLGSSIPMEGFLTTALWYAGLWTAAGLVLGIVVGRRAPVLLGAGSAFFFLAATANVAWLPGFTRPVSLAVDGALAAVTVFVAYRIVRRKKPSVAPAVWAGVAVAGLAIAVFVPWLDRPEARPPRVRADFDGDHPNVLLVVVDTLRADHTGMHGYERETTPNLDRFAKDGMVFTQARSPCSWTLPAVASLSTGLPPGIHGAERHESRLPDSAITVAEVFRDAGYETGLFSENRFVSTHFGMAQGFDRMEGLMGGHWVPRVGLAPESLLGRAVNELVRKRLGLIDTERDPQTGPVVPPFLRWLDGRPEGNPWFAHLHFMEPHWTYYPEGEWATRFGPRRKFPDLSKAEAGLSPFYPGDRLSPEVRSALIDAYDGEIAQWDHHFGYLLDELGKRGQTENLLVLVTSDHGESFYEHETWLHGTGLNEELIRVPLVLKAPGGPVGTCASTVSLEGVAETLVHAAGFVPPEEMTAAGHPLLPVPTADRDCYARMNKGASYMLSAVRNGRKWIHGEYEGRTSIRSYDLRDDPGEMRDLTSDRPEETARARSRLLWRAKQESAIRLAERSAEQDEELAEQLRGLGYIK
jgi:arylsulfatase